MKRNVGCFWLSRLQRRVEMETHLLQMSAKSQQITIATLLDQIKALVLVQIEFEYSFLSPPKTQKSFKFAKHTFL